MRFDLVLLDAGRLRFVPSAVNEVRTALAHLVDLREASRKLALARIDVGPVGKVLAFDRLPGATDERSCDSETENLG
jgi:hypothetical protein